VSEAVWELGEGHRRAAHAVLLLLDEALCTCEQWAQGRECHSVIYNERNVLSHGQQQALLKEIGEMRDLLRALQRALGLKGETRTSAGAIFQQVLATRDAVVELKSEHLRGYGELPEGLAQYLDPRLEELVQRLNRLGDIARGTGDGEARPSFQRERDRT